MKPHPQIRRIATVSRETEVALIKTILSDGQYLASAISSGLTQDHFVYDDTRMLASVIVDLFKVRGTANDVSVMSEVFERGIEEQCMPAVAELEHVKRDVYAFEDQLSRIMSAEHVRRFYDTMRRCEEELLKPGLSLLQREEVTHRSLGDLMRQVPDIDRTFMDAKQSAIYAAELVKLAEDGKRKQKQKTGVISIDHAIGGFVPGRVVLFAARPSHGKTAFSLHLAIQQNRLLRRLGEPGQVLYFSAEMGHDEMADRRMSTLSGVSADTIGAGKFNDKERERIKRAMDELVTDIRIGVDCKTRPDTTYMMSRALSQHAIEPVKLIVFDYLEYTGEEDQSKDLRLEKALMGCHEIAQRIDCPVVVDSQLNRQIDGRAGMSRPQLSDIRYTGAGEQIPALVVMLYHEWTHWMQKGNDQNIAYKSEQDRLMNEPDPNHYELLIRKNTHGPLLDIPMRWYQPTGTFIDPMAEQVLGNPF